MNQTETQASYLRLAGATKQCQVDGSDSCTTEATHYYFPETVRLRCPGVLNYNDPCYVGDAHVPEKEWHYCRCKGRGWMPNENMADWWNITSNMFWLQITGRDGESLVKIATLESVVYRQNTDVQSAFIAALEQSVVTHGLTLMDNADVAD